MTLFSKRCESVCTGRVTARVRPLNIAAVRQRHITCAHGGELGEDREIAVDHLPAFDAMRIAILPSRCAVRISSALCKNQVRRMMTHVFAYRVHLRKGALRGGRTLHPAGNPHREKDG